MFQAYLKSADGFTMSPLHHCRALVCGSLVHVLLETNNAIFTEIVNSIQGMRPASFGIDDVVVLDTLAMQPVRLVQKGITLEAPQIYAYV